MLHSVQEEELKVTENSLLAETFDEREACFEYTPIEGIAKQDVYGNKTINPSRQLCTFSFQEEMAPPLTKASPTSRRVSSPLSLSPFNRKSSKKDPPYLIDFTQKVSSSLSLHSPVSSLSAKNAGSSQELIAHIGKLEKANASLKSELEHRIERHCAEMHGVTRQLERKNVEIEILHAELVSAVSRHSAELRMAMPKGGTASPRLNGHSNPSNSDSLDKSSFGSERVQELESSILQLQEQLSTAIQKGEMLAKERLELSSLLADTKAQVLTLESYADEVNDQIRSVISVRDHQTQTIVSLQRQLDEMVIHSSTITHYSPARSDQSISSIKSEFERSCDPATMPSDYTSRKRNGAPSHGHADQHRIRETKDDSNFVSPQSAAISEEVNERLLFILWQTGGRLSRSLRRHYHPFCLFPFLLKRLGIAKPDVVVKENGRSSVPNVTTSAVRVALDRCGRQLIQLNLTWPWFGFGVALFLLSPMLCLQRLFLWLVFGLGTGRGKSHKEEERVN